MINNSASPSSSALAAALAAALIGLLLLRSPPPPHGPAGSCDSESSPPAAAAAAASAAADRRSGSTAVTVDTPLGAVRAEPCRTFSESYWEARARFLAAADAAGAEVTSLEVVPPSRAGEVGYFTDVAVLRGTAEGGRGGLVVHTSGVHGVEGYAGSAAQVAFLLHLASSSSYESGAKPRPRPRPRPTPTVVLVHALNPHGMAHYRRANENNVDLNRNALPDGVAWGEVLDRDPNAAGYDSFDASLFNPPRPPAPWDAHVGVWVRAAAAVAVNGYVSMKRAMVAGQYHNPRGVFYGGRGLERSHVLLRDFLVDGGFANVTGGAVTWIDVHTGLGPTGVDTLLVQSDPGGGGDGNGGGGGASYWFPDAPLPVRDLRAAARGGASIGYDMTRGTVDELYGALFSPNSGARFLCVTQEFGTVPSVYVARALVLENMARHHCESGGERALWARLTRDAFYVRTDDWRRRVLGRGLRVLGQAIERSSSD